MHAWACRGNIIDVLNFDSCDQVNQIVVVVPKADLDFCRNEILMTAELRKEVHLVGGGAERQDSVFIGLKTIESNDGIVLIHDGVRPFIRQSHLVACIDGAAEFGACILGIPAFDTVKKVNSKNQITQTLKRDKLWLAQTPQAFELMAAVALVMFIMPTLGGGRRPSRPEFELPPYEPDRE